MPYTDAREETRHSCENPVTRVWLGVWNVLWSRTELQEPAALVWFCHPLKPLSSMTHSLFSIGSALTRELAWTSILPRCVFCSPLLLKCQVLPQHLSASLKYNSFLFCVFLLLPFSCSLSSLPILSSPGSNHKHRWKYPIFCSCET